MEELLLSQWVPDLRKAIAGVRAKLGEEDVYAIALYSSPECVYVTLSANTEQGLERVAASYGGDVRLRSMSLRWNPADWDFHSVDEDPLSSSVHGCGVRTRPELVQKAAIASSFRSTKTRKERRRDDRRRQDGSTRRTGQCS